MIQMLELFDALEHVKQGGRIAMTDWSEGYWVELVNGQLHLHKPDDQYYPWIISGSDLAAENWAALD